MTPNAPSEVRTRGLSSERAINTPGTWKLRILVTVVIAVLVGAVAAALITRRSLTNQMNASAAHTATTPILDRIRQMVTLVTIRRPVSHVQTSQSPGTTGAARLILIVHGDVEVGVDLDRAELHGVDQAAHRATLVMHEPKPHRPRLNHERTRI